MSESDDILFEVRGKLGLVTLNRPQALNAFTLDMYRRLDPVLRAWEADPAIAAVAIQGAGDRAFCAGGDIRAIYEAGQGRKAQGIGADPGLTRDFFREEYRLIRRVHRYAKPYIAIIDGITMGGGAGMALNGGIRVATERTVFAMPENGIGLFPDVGATRFLNACPGRVGRYLGLTGARLGAADTLYCGLATHFVPVERLDALLMGLARGEDVAGFAGDPGPSPLKERQAEIDRLFAADTVEAIVGGLGEDMRKAVGRGSPTSLKVFLRQMDVGRGYDLDAALKLEFRISQHVMAGHDFYEGVRALIIDRDQSPAWQPATLGDVDAATVDGYFASLGDRELTFE
ncbi:MAG TPA: enoyl-CoA hydratase/isomerase family protein [Stellaceae bacterium]|jgi:enoyl-CoA hydratase|nr:enoyl-CoA hydratase/isomerase family protein [Stellaceae bacterium]